jgi:hypothetical protein
LFSSSSSCVYFLLSSSNSEGFPTLCTCVINQKPQKWAQTKSQLASIISNNALSKKLWNPFCVLRFKFLCEIFTLSSNSERGVQHCAARFANVFQHRLHCISALCKCVFVLSIIASLVWATVFLCCLHCVSTICKCISPLSALRLHYVHMHFTIVYVTSALCANVFHRCLHCISTMCKRFSSLSALHLH